MKFCFPRRIVFTIIFCTTLAFGGWTISNFENYPTYRQRFQLPSSPWERQLQCQLNRGIIFNIRCSWSLEVRLVICTPAAET
jgi:hypothetical protein